MADGKIDLGAEQAIKEINLLKVGIDEATKSLIELNKGLITSSASLRSNATDSKTFSDVTKQLANQEKLLADQAQKIVDLNGKLKKSLKEYTDEELKKAAVNRENLSLQKQKIILNDAESGTIEKITAQNKLLTAEQKRLNLETEQGRVRHTKIIKELNDNDAALIKLGSTMQKQKANIGNYTGANWGLSNSINQLTREMPAFANSVGTGFMAISNNIPMFVDQINNLTAANKAMREDGQKTIPVWKQLLGSMFSWQTVLSVGVTLLTVYGAKLISYFSGEDSETKKATKNINEQAEAVDTLSQAINKQNIITSSYKITLDEETQKQIDLINAKEVYFELQSKVNKQEVEHIKTLDSDELNYYNESIKKTGDITKINTWSIEQLINKYKELSLYKKNEMFINEDLNALILATIKLKQAEIAVKEESNKKNKNAKEINEDLIKQQKKYVKINEDLIKQQKEYVEIQEFLIKNELKKSETTDINTKALKDQIKSLEDFADTAQLGDLEYLKLKKDIDDYIASLEKLNEMKPMDKSKGDTKTAIPNFDANKSMEEQRKKEKADQEEDQREKEKALKEELNLISKKVEILNAVSVATGAIGTLGSAIYDRQIANETFATDQKLNNAKKVYEQNIANGISEVDAKAKYEADKNAIELDYNRKIAKIKHKQAEWDKASSIVQASIDLTAAIIALGVVTPAAIAAAVLGGANLAIAVMKPIPPIPEYWKGTDNHRGGLAYVGERGTELVETNKGSFLTPAQTTLMDLPRGAKVHTHEETMRMARSGQMQQLDSQGIIKAIKDQKQVSVNVNEKVYIALKQGQNRTNFINQKYRS